MVLSSMNPVHISHGQLLIFS